MKLYKIKKSKIDNKGRGLYATRNIKAGTKIIDYIGKIITNKEVENSNKFDNKKFPLPSYTFNQHSYLDRILSKDFLIKEDSKKRQELTYLRKAYNSFTLPGTLLMLFNK